MDKRIKVLAINPGSTSTKIALFEDYDEVFSSTIHHSNEELKAFKDIQDQLGYRRDTIVKSMADNGHTMEEADVFVGRGGGLLSVEGGTYEVTDLLAEHASKGMTGQHPAQLGSQLAKYFADKYCKRAFVVNPPDVDEFCGEARLTGVRGVYRESHIHALNQKEIALRFCAGRGVRYEEVNLVICHIGGGISVTAHEKGRMIDSNDIIKGSGPMTPTRAGDLPYMSVIDMAYSGEYTKKQLVDKLNKDGGITDHFGMADMREIERRFDEGDRDVQIVVNGMIYQIAKYAGAMAVALKGDVQAVILTGGLARWKYFSGKISEYAGWIAEIAVMPGEFELEALAAGAVRVMRGEEGAKTYTGVPVWSGF